MTDPPRKRDFPFSPAAGATGEPPACNPEDTDPNFQEPRVTPNRPIAIVRAGGSESGGVPGKDFPEQIGPYKLLKELARGGMGAVYLAVDVGLNRQVALKVMNKDLIQDHDALVRFQREARATASVVHPNIAMVYLVGSADDGSPFLAMEYVEGGTLEGLIHRKVQLPLSRIADMMIQCCEALSAAHKKAIIHRDIKPGNIMLTNDGTVKIVDFGLAKMIHEDSYRTVAGTVMGTPRYMAPEQTQGREVDYRADIYSLGATFYHLLAGRPPFDGANPTQIMMKHVTAPVVPMRNINPEVPIEFDDVIRRCLLKDPNGRHLDYLDLIGDLGKLKVQFMARERGSLVSSMSDLPTMRLGRDGMPLAPGSAPQHPSDRSVIGAAMDAQSDAVEGSGTLRYVLMAGAALLVIAAVLFALFMPRKEPEAETASANPQARSGLQVLIERLESQANRNTTTTTTYAADPDYLAYLATREILDELGRGMFTFSVEKGRHADSIVELAGSGAAVQLYDMSPRGVPLDGWGRPLDYARGQQAIISMGLDGRLNTADDMRVDSEGEIVIEDLEPYDALEERERIRLGRR